MPRARWLAALLALPIAAAAGSPDDAVARGEYLLHAGGCLSCHTEDADGAVPLAGGRALPTPFGTFFSPNITPDPVTGIGRWSAADFLRAFWEGRAPDGSHYYPAFPYPAYTGISAEDLLAIRAYLFSLPPVTRSNRPHELPWYLQFRPILALWKLIYFAPARFAADEDRDAEWNRGAYLVRHLGHCAECHSPRTLLGAVDPRAELAGNPQGGENERVPNITPDRDSGIGKWTAADLELFLEVGMLPDGDFAGGSMSEVIDDNTSQLTPPDRAAIAAYLKALPPLAAEP